jgi:hypothetical protein
MTDTPFCCAACRLLQDPTTACIDCGSALIGRLDAEQELLRWTSLSMRPDEGSTRSRRVSAIDLPSPAIAHGAISRSGTARAITAPLRSLLDDAPILAEQISLITRWRRSVFLRRVHAAPFLLDAPEPTVIAGVLRLLPHARPAHPRVADDDPRLARLGIPPHFLEGATLEVVTLHPGDAISVTGVLGSERLPELAMYRDAVELPMLFGVAGSVVRVAI